MLNYYLQDGCHNCVHCEAGGNEYGIDYPYVGDDLWCGWYIDHGDPVQACPENLVVEAAGTCDHWEKREPNLAGLRLSIDTKPNKED